MLRSILLFASLSSIFAAAPAQAISSKCGVASFYGYGDGYAWRTMANGQPMDPQGMTTAHPSIPFGTKLAVVNQDNGKKVVLSVTDRGPYAGGRILDLSHGAFARIASPSQGLANICYSMV